MNRSLHAALAVTLTVLFSLPAALAAEKAFDPCSLLTPAEIQAAVGKPVKPGTPKVRSNPLAGSDCTYVVGDFGSLNVLSKPLQRGESPEVFKAQFAKMNMKPTDAAGIGDAAFFTSPGFEMVQLHAFQSGRYILITMLVPGSKEMAARPMAAKLMRTLLPRFK